MASWLAHEMAALADMGLFGIMLSGTLEVFTNVSAPMSRSEITWAASSHCEGDIKVETSSIASLNALQLITEDGAIGRGLKGNFAQNAWPGLLALSNAGKSFLSFGSMTGDGGGGGDGLPSNHPSKVARLTPYRSETNRDTLTML